MQAGAKIVYVGGTTVSPGAESTLCKAFVSAAKRFCDDKGKRNGKRFNDYYFEDLKSTEPDGAGLREQIERESAFVVSNDGASAESLSDAADRLREEGDPANAWKLDGLASKESILQETAQLTEELKETGLLAGAEGLGWDKLRSSMNLASWRTLDDIDASMRYTDGMLDGQVLEIKGPKDKFGKGQLEDLQKINPDKPVIEISCQACAAPCHDEGNKCPPRSAAA